MNRSRRVLGIAATAIAVAFAATACHKPFDPKLYASSSEALFNASLAQYKKKNYGDAAKGFEQLTRDLPARDPRLPVSYYYLGQSQEKDGSHLLAAQSFSRIAEAFPDDTLADDALLLAGYSYAEMWRKPELDPTYGKSAQTTFQSLRDLYPDSPLVPKADTALAHLDDMFATKDLETGEHYMHRGAYDSAIIYLKDVIQLHPRTPAARQAYLKLVESYRAIHYTADARDACDAMIKAYPNDREVREQCGSASSAEASTPHT